MDMDEFQTFTFVPQPLPPPTRDYRADFGRNPNIIRLRRFTENTQWRKLFDLNPLCAVLSDKIAAKHFVASRVGSEWLPQLLWTGDTVDHIPFDTLPTPFILKCNHGSSLNVVVTDGATIDREKARETLRSGLARPYGNEIHEPGYMPI